MGRKNKTSRANKMYRNKDYEQSKKYIDRRNEIITYRLLILFCVAVCAVVFLIYAVNVTWAEIKKLETASFIGLIITGAPLTVSAIFLVYRGRQAIDESDRVAHSKNVFAVSLILFAGDLVIYFTGQRWIPALTALVITATVLVYIYYLYQREFFYFSLFAAASCFFLYLAGAQFLSYFFRTGFRVLLAACAVFIVVFSLALMKSKGLLKSKSLNLNIKILEKNSKYFQFFILAVFVAGFAAASFFPVNFFYLACALAGCFIVIGVYFTVKMI